VPAADQGVHVSAGRYHLIPRVLCFVFRGDEVLLLRGAPDKKLWAGKHNGLGGHVERGETVHAAAEREIREEAGLSVSGLRLRGVVTIDTGQAAGIGLYVYSAHAATRQVRASAEGELLWVPASQAGALDCVEDVPQLLARLIEAPDDAPPFAARYSYDTSGQLVMEFHAA
jgi:8-oxo-dGTP diphosphatase